MISSAVAPGLVLLLTIAVCCPAMAQWHNDPAVNTPVCTAPNQQNPLTIASDGAGGTIIAWADQRNGAEYDIYGQRIDPTGDVVWASQGLAIATAPDLQAMSCITTNGYGGIILAWSDFRSSNGDIYAQQVTADGILGGINPTVNARLTCIPDTGTLPFGSQITVTLDNLYTGHRPDGWPR